MRGRGGREGMLTGDRMLGDADRFLGRGISNERARGLYGWRRRAKAEIG